MAGAGGAGGRGERRQLSADVRTWPVEDAWSLARKMHWLGGLPLGEGEAGPVWACTCPWGWRPMGRLHEVNMGSDWVRLRESRECPAHGTVAKR